MLNKFLDYTYQSCPYCCAQTGYDSCTARGEAWGHPWHLTRIRAGSRVVAGVETVLQGSEQGCPVPTSAGPCSQCCCSEQLRRSKGDKGAAHLITVSIIRGLQIPAVWSSVLAHTFLHLHSGNGQGNAMQRCPAGRGGKGVSLRGEWLSEEDGDPLSHQTRLLWSKVSWPWEDGQEQGGVRRETALVLPDQLLPVKLTSLP